jgi:hypothetical protein
MKKSLLFVTALLLVGCSASLCACQSGQTDSGQSLKTQPKEIIQDETPDDVLPELPPDDDYEIELPPQDGNLPQVPPDAQTPPPPCHGIHKHRHEAKRKFHRRKHDKLPEEEKPDTDNGDDTNGDVSEDN